MFRRFISFILAVAIMATMWIIPVDATTTSSITLPSGDAFAVVADVITDDFKTGDTIKVKLKISDIKEGLSFVDVYLKLVYNPNVLEPVTDLFTSSCDEINASDSEVDWVMIPTDSTQGTLTIYFEDGNYIKGVSESGALWVELVFTAKTDNTNLTSDILAYTSNVTATESQNYDSVEGTGVCLAALLPTVAPTSEPTVEPTEVPTVEPTEAPTYLPTATPVPVPTVAPTTSPSYGFKFLNSQKFFSVDYRTGSSVERVGGGAPIYTQVATQLSDPMDLTSTLVIPTDTTYVQDAELNSTVAYFDSTYSMGYEVDHSKLVNDFTVEVYYKIGTSQARWGMLCGTLWMQSDTAVHGFALTHTGMKLNGITDETLKTDTNNPAYVGPHRKYLCGWSIGNGVQGCSNISFPGDGTAATMRENKDKWIHMVYTHDGTTECLYVDGVKWVEQEAPIKEIVHDTSNEMASLFRIGGYNWANNWDMDDAYVACVNMYNTAATADVVAELYAYKDTILEVDETPLPSPIPAPVPGPDYDILDNLYFGVDFNNQDVVDLAGNHTYDENWNMNSSNLMFEFDETIGRNVLVLEGDGALAWTNDNGESLDGYDLSDGLTMEAYAYISTDPDEFKSNMTIIEAVQSALHFQEYNDGSDFASGFRCGDTANGGYDMANAYVEETFPHMEWIHIVGVSDGTENRYYLNGELKAIYPRSQTLLKSMYNQGDGSICIGESTLGSMWGATAFYGRIAFANIYKDAASVAQVDAMYLAATGSDSSVSDEFTYETYTDYCVITGYYGTDEVVVIPSKIDGLPVTGIGSGAFMGNEYITSVEMPDSINIILDYAFAGCMELSEVKLSKNLLVIEEASFLGCNKLQEIEIPKSVVTIYDGAFYGCGSLKSIEIPEGITEIGASMFHACMGLESVTLPSTIQYIGNGAFRDCIALDTVYFNGSESDFSFVYIDLYNEFFESADKIYELSDEDILPEPTDEPITTPEPTTTPVTTPVPEVNLPEGTDYLVKSSPVFSFKAGDTVKVKFTVSNIATGLNLLGFDWELAYNSDILVPELDLWTSSCDTINSANSGSAWELITVLRDADTVSPYVSVTLMDDGDSMVGLSSGGELWVEAVFTAITDGNADDIVAWFQAAEGAINDAEFSVAYGSAREVSVLADPITELNKEKTRLSSYISSLGDGFECVAYKDGEEVSLNTYISTGMILVITDTVNSEVYAIEVVVYGDINGDGKVATSDYMYVKSAITNNNVLTGDRFAAADVNADGVLTATDYMKIKSHFKGVYDLFGNI